MRAACLKQLESAALALACLSFGIRADAAEAGFYAGVDVAVIEPTVGASEGILVFVPPLISTRVSPESTKVDGPATGWSAVLGYRINRHLAGELAYTDWGLVDIEEVFDLADAIPIPVEPPVASANSGSHVAGPSISLLGVLPIAEGFEAFARAGLLFATQEPKLAPNPGVFSNPKLSLSEELWLVGFGIDVEIGRRLSARFEYQTVDRLPRNVVNGPIRLERYAFGVTYDF